MSSETSSKKERLCGLCDSEPSKYCCPRCEVFYCSLNCYKSDKHVECSENFYRECVNKELASQEVDDESKARMIDILKRMHEEDIDEDVPDEEIDSDDCSEIDLHMRVKDLNLDDPEILWDALTEDEKNEFEALLCKGEVENIIPQWEPWWLFHKEKKLVEDVKDSNEMDILKNCPELKSVAKFNSLTSVKPSPAIRFNIANVVSSYVFTMRYFNGEIEAVEAAHCILDICTNLSSNSNFDNPELAVESVAQKCLQSEYIQTDELSLDVMKEDTMKILKGPSEDNSVYYTKAAFSHLIQIFTDAKSLCKTKCDATEKNSGDFSKKFPEHKNYHLPNLDLGNIKKVIKKLEYYLSFLDSCDDKISVL